MAEEEEPQTRIVWPGIGDVIAALDQLGAELRDASPEVLAVYIKQGTELIANFRTFVETLKHLYAELHDAGGVDKKVTYQGVGTVEVLTSVKRTAWDHEALWAAVVARALDERLVDEETGEFEREGDTISRALRDCATPSWKVTGLRRHGINPEEFCHEEWGAKGVRIDG